MNIRSIEYIKAATHWQDGPEDGLPEVAMIGRSNVGKSSLINLLTGRKMAHVAKAPGKTQLIQYFLVNHAFYLVDLPGYGYAKVGKQTKKAWGPMIDAYMTKRKTLCAVGLLIDIRRADSPLDFKMREWLAYHQIKTFCVITKGDKIAKGKRKAHVDAIKSAYGIEDPILTSSLKKEGKNNIWKSIEAILPDRKNPDGKKGAVAEQNSAPHPT